MIIGQHVYMQRDPTRVHSWYEATIVSMRLKTRTGVRFRILLRVVDTVTCWSCRPTEYTVKLKDGSQHVVRRNQLLTHI